MQYKGRQDRAQRRSDHEQKEFPDKIKFHGTLPVENRNDPAIARAGPLQRKAVCPEKLPKTRSGKIMRRLLKAQELGRDVGDISTLEECSHEQRPRKRPMVYQIKSVRL